MLATDAPNVWNDPYEKLRHKWHEVPYSVQTRISTHELVNASDAEVLSVWNHAASTTVELNCRGWYHEMYREKLRGKKVLDVGSGLGVSPIFFAEHGAKITVADIVPDNLRLLRRVCELRGIEAEYLYIESEKSFDALAHDYDYVTALGSLINCPLDVTRTEIQSILPHLKPGGRWLHFAYPKARWEREGRLPFELWGQRTDGENTPYVVYHNREEVDYLFSPYQYEIVFDCEWHNNDFNWFDLKIYPPK